MNSVGGHILAHASATRILLRYVLTYWFRFLIYLNNFNLTHFFNRKGRGEERVAKLLDSPDMPEAECVYVIGAGGINDSVWVSEFGLLWLMWLYTAREIWHLDFHPWFRTRREKSVLYELVGEHFAVNVWAGKSANFFFFFCFYYTFAQILSVTINEHIRFICIYLKFVLSCQTLWPTQTFKQKQTVINRNYGKLR